MSFMTSDEMTTGSVHATEAERKWLAGQSRWWNSTGGGTMGKLAKGVNASAKGVGAVKAGDGGLKFKAEWPELDEQNKSWMSANRIDLTTGNATPDPNAPASSNCSPETAALRRRLGVSTPGLGAVVGGGQAARDAGQSWIRRNKFIFGGLVLIGYVLLARLLGDTTTT